MNSIGTASRPAFVHEPRAAALSIEPLTGADAALWDESIAGYRRRQVFHSQAWLDYLAASRGVQVRKWAVRCGSRTLGYLCGGQLSKGPFRILGSPLKGWGTNNMGPLLKEDVDLVAYLAAVDDLARAEGLAVVETEHPDLEAPVMESLGYTASTLWTYRLLLELDEDAMLKRMSKGRRWGIKKAIKSGLVVEASTSVSLADEYYDLFTQTMKAKGLPSSYDCEVPRLLMKHVGAAGSLIGLRVRHPDGQVLAAGLFPFGNGTLYFWGGASVADRSLCPNDLLHWHAMCAGARMGLTMYDLSGWGQFKKEFGGELITVNRWHKCYWKSARWARQAYESFQRRRTRLFSALERLKGTA